VSNRLMCDAPQRGFLVPGSRIQNLRLCRSDLACVGTQAKTESARVRERFDCVGRGRDLRRFDLVNDRFGRTCKDGPGQNGGPRHRYGSVT